MDHGTELARGQAEESASRAYVQEALAGEGLDAEHPLQGLVRPADMALVDHVEEALPVLTELEALASKSLLRAWLH